MFISRCTRALVNYSCGGGCLMYYSVTSLLYITGLLIHRPNELWRTIYLIFDLGCVAPRRNQFYPLRSCNWIFFVPGSLSSCNEELVWLMNFHYACICLSGEFFRLINVGSPFYRRSVRGARSIMRWGSRIMIRYNSVKG